MVKPIFKGQKGNIIMMKMSTSKNGKLEITKPCRKLNFCPYGALIEQFPLPVADEHRVLACAVFGHVCPIFCDGVLFPFVDSE